MGEFCGTIYHNAIMFHTLRWLYGDVLKSNKANQRSDLHQYNNKAASGSNYSTVVVWLHMPAMRYIYTWQTEAQVLYEAKCKL